MRISGSIKCGIDIERSGVAPQPEWNSRPFSFECTQIADAPAKHQIAKGYDAICVHSCGRVLGLRLTFFQVFAFEASCDAVSCVLA